MFRENCNMRATKYHDGRINCDSKRILRTRCHYILSRDITCLTVITTVFVLFPLYVLNEEERQRKQLPSTVVE